MEPDFYHVYVQVCISFPGGKEDIFSSGARFQPIYFLSSTDQTRPFLNSVK